MSLIKVCIKAFHPLSGKTEESKLKVYRQERN